MYLDGRSALWRNDWSLYRELGAVAGDTRKVFESRHDSLIV